MKKIFILFVLILLAGCKAKNAAPRIVKIDASEVDASQKNKAYDLGKRVLNSCNTSRFKPFNSNEATAEVIKNTTPEKISRTCQKFLLKYGAFKDIKLAEVIQNKTDKTTIFRYKAVYERKFVTKELRVTMNEDNKVSAIQSTNWTDEYKQ